MPLHDEDDKDWQDFIRSDKSYQIGRKKILDFINLPAEISDKQLIEATLEKLKHSSNHGRSLELDVLRALARLFDRFSINDQDFSSMEAEFIRLRRFYGLEP